MSGLADPPSRIPIIANRGVTGALFGLAIITYLTRAYIRLRVLKQTSTEDFLLLFAVICLTGTTALGFITLQDQYDALSLELIVQSGNTSQLFVLLEEIPNISADEVAAKTENAAATIWWFVLFPVKLAYLFFFRRLISRVGSLTYWWWFVFIYTILAGLSCVAAAWLTCPYFTLEGVLSCEGPATTYRAIRDTSITTVMDITTDLTVISFPLALLYRVRIDLRQKIGAGLSLCLSLAMVIVAIIRMSGIVIAGGTVDIVWLAFWQQQECSIAVIMVSVSAFRSFFIAKQNNYPARRRGVYMPSYGRFVGNVFDRRRRSRPRGESDLEKTNGMPTIPSATLTGVHTRIREMRMSRIWPSGRESGGMMRLDDVTQVGSEGTQTGSEGTRVDEAIELACWRSAKDAGVQVCEIPRAHHMREEEEGLYAGKRRPGRESAVIRDAVEGGFRGTDDIQPRGCRNEHEIGIAVA